MKIAHALVAVVASVALCSQAEAQLLDRIMGMGGCGCKSTCCDTPVAGAGCGTNAVVAPSCDTGCNDGCDTGCGRAKLIDFRFRVNWDAMPRPFARLRSAGCGGGCDTGCDTGCAPAAKPACGTNVVAGGCGDCTKTAAPSCGTDKPACGGGCDSGCNDGCGRFNFGLMDRLRNLRARIAARPRLFSGMGGCGCDSGCSGGCDSGCGSAAPSCGTNQPQPAAAPKAAPVQPTPAAAPKG